MIQFPSEMPSVQSEFHHHVQKSNLTHELSSIVQKIMDLDPELIVGRCKLFEHDSMNHTLVLSSSFQELLQLLVNLDELDPRALEKKSLGELNSILQQPQGTQGGLLREKGKERWDLKDNPVKQEQSAHFDALFKLLGFVDPLSIDDEMNVDDCLAFGATAERMLSRGKETLGYLNNNLHIRENGHLCLLGSNRKLIDEEKECLKFRLDSLDESRKLYWEGVFEDPEQCTEVQASLCLWECIASQKIQNLLKNNLVSVDSHEHGSSYDNHGGHRATTQVTAKDWMIKYYSPDKPQAIFALAEQPYIRLPDQLKFTVLSDDKKANVDELMRRIKNTTFYFASPKPNSPPLISVVLDEIGRNVYRTVDALKYVESLEAKE